MGQVQNISTLSSVYASSGQHRNGPEAANNISPTRALVGHLGENCINKFKGAGPVPVKQNMLDCSDPLTSVLEASCIDTDLLFRL